MATGNSKQKQLIPAVGYLRKSTKGEGADGKERQEKSIAQQKKEITVMGKGRFKIVAWYTDDGISGWKREAKRPDFQRMLQEAKDLGAQAVLCDHLDRFSRATVDEVQLDAHELRRAGVRWIVTASHGEYDLGKRHDIGEILKFVVAVWSANEYSRQLGRRVILARRNAALEGKRTGGEAPYGLALAGADGKPIVKGSSEKCCTLIWGDPKERKTVRWIFDQFVNHKRAMNWIAGELNRKGVPGPRGGKWYRATIKEMLDRRAYRGDFSFNEQRSGQFYQIDDNREVVEANGTTQRKAKDKGVIVTEGRYKPLIDPATFDKAQKRLEVVGKNRRRRKRQGYPLTGILFCARCNKPLYGCKPNSHAVYRCSSNGNEGSDACGYYQVREADILPFVLRLLGEEIADLKTLITSPPDELAEPWKERTEQRDQLERQQAQLTAKIAKAEENLLFVEDARTRKSLDERVSKMRDELEQLGAELATDNTAHQGFTGAELDALDEWYAALYKAALRMPLSAKLPETGPLQDHCESNVAVVDNTGREQILWNADGDVVDTEEQSLLVDGRLVNEALHTVGTKVQLRWKSEEYETSGGKTRRRHTLARGRFRLGQQNGKVPQHVLHGSAQRACGVVRRSH